MPRISTLPKSRRAIGRRVKQARLDANLSQRQLSIPGITAAYVSRIEGGYRSPSLEALAAIGDRVGVTALELWSGDPDTHCPICHRDA